MIKNEYFIIIPEMIIYWNLVMINHIQDTKEPPFLEPICNCNTLNYIILIYLVPVVSANLFRFTKNHSECTEVILYTVSRPDNNFYIKTKSLSEHPPTFFCLDGKVTYQSNSVDLTLLQVFFEWKNKLRHYSLKYFEKFGLVHTKRLCLSHCNFHLLSLVKLN